MSQHGYVPEIDGLRAVAVMLVLGFHVGFPGITGGFVGVDIFFVISGYLMARLYGADIGGPKFSPAGFLWRRIRRLLPAYVVCLAAVLVAASIISTPAEIDQTGRSATFSALFLSNVFFGHGTGYFDPAADMAPLLHTWSLGVEMQFYLLFAVGGWFLLKIGRSRASLLVGVLGLASFVGAEIAVRSGSEALAFFHVPFRLWEFGVGIAVAAVPPLAGKWKSAIGVVGLVVIGSAASLTTEAHFPGLAAVPACLGAAAILVAVTGANGSGAPVLGWRPIVLIGAASYSIYLWHWPVIVFIRQAGFMHGAEIKVVAIVASIALGFISWRLIEGPGQRWLSMDFGSGKWIATGSAVAVVILGGLLISRSYAVTAVSEIDERCTDVALADGVQGCVFGNASPGLVFWGDSHVKNFIGFSREIAALSGTASAHIITLSCPPFVGAVPGYKKKSRIDACRKSNDAAWDYIRSDGVDAVFLAGRWSLYGETLPFGRQKVLKLLREDGSPRSRIETIKNTIQGLRRAGKTVYVMKQVPELFAASPRKCMSVLGFSSSYCALDVGETERANADFYAAVYALAAHDPEVRVLDFAEFFCTGGKCSPTVGEAVAYRDDNHLSVHGSDILGRLAIQRGLFAGDFGARSTSTIGP